MVSSVLDTRKPTSLRPRAVPAAAAPEAAEEVGESDMVGCVRRGGAALAARGTSQVLGLAFPSWARLLFSQGGNTCGVCCVPAIVLVRAEFI
jgi:hypothetical protein